MKRTIIKGEKLGAFFLLASACVILANLFLTSCNRRQETQVYLERCIIKIKLNEKGSKDLFVKKGQQAICIDDSLLIVQNDTIKFRNFEFLRSFCKQDSSELSVDTINIIPNASGTNKDSVFMLENNRTFENYCPPKNKSFPLEEKTLTLSKGECLIIDSLCKSHKRPLLVLGNDTWHPKEKVTPELLKSNSLSRDSVKEQISIKEFYVYKDTLFARFEEKDSLKNIRIYAQFGKLLGNAKSDGSLSCLLKQKQENTSYYRVAADSCISLLVRPTEVPVVEAVKVSPDPTPLYLEYPWYIGLCVCLAIIESVLLLYFLIKHLASHPRIKGWMASIHNNRGVRVKKIELEESDSLFNVNNICKRFTYKHIYDNEKFVRGYVLYCSIEMSVREAKEYIDYLLKNYYESSDRTLEAFLNDQINKKENYESVKVKIPYYWKNESQRDENKKNDWKYYGQLKIYIKKIPSLESYKSQDLENTPSDGRLRNLLDNLINQLPNDFKSQVNEIQNQLSELIENYNNKIDGYEEALKKPAPRDVSSLQSLLGKNLQLNQESYGQNNVNEKDGNEKLPVKEVKEQVLENNNTLSNILYISYKKKSKNQKIMLCQSIDMSVQDATKYVDYLFKNYYLEQNENLREYLTDQITKEGDQELVKVSIPYYLERKKKEDESSKKEWEYYKQYGISLKKLPSLECCKNFPQPDDTPFGRLIELLSMLSDQVQEDALKSKVDEIKNLISEIKTEQERQVEGLRSTLRQAQSDLSAKCTKSEQLTLENEKLKKSIDDEVKKEVSKTLEKTKKQLEDLKDKLNEKVTELTTITGKHNTLKNEFQKLFREHEALEAEKKKILLDHAKELEEQKKKNDIYEKFIKRYEGCESYTTVACQFFDILSQLKKEQYNLCFKVSEKKMEDEDKDLFNYYYISVTNKFYKVISDLKFDEFRKELIDLNETEMTRTGKELDQILNTSSPQKYVEDLRYRVYESLFKHLCGAAIVLSDDLGSLDRLCPNAVSKEDTAKFAGITQKLLKVTQGMGYKPIYVKLFTSYKDYSDISVEKQVNLDKTKVGDITEVLEMAVNYGTQQSKTKVSANI